MSENKPTFYSMYEMIDYMHNLIQNDEVKFYQKINNKFPKLNEEILKQKKKFPLIDQPFISNLKKPKIKRQKIESIKNNINTGKYIFSLKTFAIQNLRYILDVYCLSLNTIMWV